MVVDSYDQNGVPKKKEHGMSPQLRLKVGN